MPSFADLPLCPELQFALQQLNYSQPTPIQLKAIPLILQGHDLMAEAQTGTGKTASFALPMIEIFAQQEIPEGYKNIRGLVLVPTRELAIQVADATLEYGKALGMRVISVYGGIRFENQVRKMKGGADILVATPGRLLDMLTQGKLQLNDLQTLVFDEADRMLDLGFIDAIKSILGFCPKKYQTLLFSATSNESIDLLADYLLTSPKHVKTTPRNSTAQHIKQLAYAVDNKDKTSFILRLAQDEGWKKTLIFTRTKVRADQLYIDLVKAGIDAAVIHGDRSQKERVSALQAFTSSEVDILVATDVAARGLDIPAIPRVVNFDMPNVSEDYVHRIGRTGRAGEEGIAISLVGSSERGYLADIELLIKRKLKMRTPQLQSQGKGPDTSSGKKKKGKGSSRKTGAEYLRDTTDDDEKDSAIPAIRPSPFG